MADGIIPSAFCLIRDSHPAILLQHFAYSRFGIEEHPVANCCVGDLPGIPERLKCPRRDMQVFADPLARQVAFGLN